MERVPKESEIQQESVDLSILELISAWNKTFLGGD